MDKRIFLLPLIIFVLLIGTWSVFAKSKADIAYPVRQLGNCANEQECRTYCDDLRHIGDCLAFAQEHNLLSAEEFAQAKRFVQLGVESGPGGCTSEASCHAYCEDVSHITECLAFAEQYGVMEEEELAEARRVAEALGQGAKLPGGCRNKEQCEAYCEDPSHINECLAFAGAAGFMTAEELEEARRIAPFMARGEMPGGCRSKQQCETYCSDENNIEECAAFFEKAGFITPEEAEMFRKTGGKGPGACQGREECEAFCNDPANQSACFEFAKEHDLISEEELRNIEEGVGRFKEGFQNAPPEVAQCLRERIGEEVLAKIEAGTFLPNPQLGEHMRGCFEQFMPASQQGGPMPDEGFGGGEGMVPPEAAGCVERILGDMPQLQGPPSPELEQRIRQECFPQYFEGPVVNPEEFHGEFEGQYQEEFQGQFEQQYQQEFQQQFEQQSPPPPQEFPSEESLQESRIQRQSFLSAVVEAMRPGLKVLFPFLPL